MRTLLLICLFVAVFVTLGSAFPINNLLGFDLSKLNIWPFTDNNDVSGQLTNVGTDIAKTINDQLVRSQRSVNNKKAKAAKKHKKNKKKKSKKNNNNDYGDYNYGDYNSAANNGNQDYNYGDNSNSGSTNTGNNNAPPPSNPKPPVSQSGQSSEAQS
ncbi:hypothetical protein M3Y97_00751300 [Aphelenchoides bicaudatus]|nr:hypothetical protein M3Y97_00751300 [Aphelenchoides bicaudatus]